MRFYLWCLHINAHILHTFNDENAFFILSDAEKLSAMSFILHIHMYKYLFHLLYYHASLGLSVTLEHQRSRSMYQSIIQSN